MTAEVELAFANPPAQFVILHAEDCGSSLCRNWKHQTTLAGNPDKYVTSFTSIMSVTSVDPAISANPVIDAVPVKGSSGDKDFNPVDCLL
jgi:hypothetical protein